MPDFYFILFLKRLDADEKLQYFQLPYIPCRMVSGNEIKLWFNRWTLVTCRVDSNWTSDGLGLGLGDIKVNEISKCTK
jgi:hypothetical protein